MNDERLRWALEQLAVENKLAEWALGRNVPPDHKRMYEKMYADHFKLPQAGDPDPDGYGGLGGGTFKLKADR